MRNRVWILLSLLLVTALVLGACAGSGSAPAEAPAEEAAAEEPAAEEEAAEEAEPTEEPEEEAAEEPAEEAAAAECGLTIWADDTRAPVLESLGEAFEAEYGIPIIVTEKAFGDIRDDLAIAGPTGEGPAIIIGAHDWLGQLVENGLVAEMSLVHDGVNGYTDKALP